MDLPDSSTFAAAVADRRFIIAAVVAMTAGLVRGFSGFGHDPVIHAINSRVGDQRVLGQVVKQHVEAEDVVGHQQLSRRGGGLGRQALAQGVGLLVHGLFELQTHHAGVDHQSQGDQDHVMAGDA